MMINERNNWVKIKTRYTPYFDGMDRIDDWQTKIQNIDTIISIRNNDTASICMSLASAHR